MPIHIFRTIDDPLAIPGRLDTTASGINDAGQIVGTYTDDSGAHGFLRSSCFVLHSPSRGKITSQEATTCSKTSSMSCVRPSL
jgi:hypothetical protein